MSPRAKLFLVAAALAVAVPLAGASAASAEPGPLGTLMQPAGSLGCVSAYPEDSGCAAAPAAKGAFFVSPSPDGKHVYVGGGSFSFANVGAFTRGEAGQLTPIAGSCLLQEGSGPVEGCVEQRGLENLSDVEVSPDGRQVYVAAQGAFSPDDTTITTYDRDPGTGAIRPVPGPDGCLSSTALEGCRTAAHISNTVALVFDPSGERLYTAQNGDGQGGGVTMLERDPATGRLSQPGGDLSCTWDAGATSECRAGDGMEEVWDLAITPDGDSLYAAGQSGGYGTLSRAAVQPDGSIVQSKDASGCFTDAEAPGHCSPAAGMGAGFGAPFGLAISPDGRSLYLSAPGTFGPGDDTLTVFQLGQDGSVSQPSGAAACFTPDTDPATEGCGQAKALLGMYDVAVSADGAYVYAASYRGLGNNGGLAVFERDSEGLISPLPEPYGCVTSYEAAEGCTQVRGMAGANGLGVSPDGETVYVAAFDASSVAVLSHQAAPDCGAAGASVEVTQGETVTLPLDCREPNGEPQAYEIASGPAHGALGQIDQESATVAYTADASFTGSDTVRYASTDGKHRSAAEGTIEISVVARQAPPPPPPSGSSRLVVLGKAVKPDARGRLALRLRCESDGPACAGALTLATARKVPLRKGKPKRKLKLATLRYSVPAGATSTVRTRLSKAELKLLARLRRMPVLARTAPGAPAEQGTSRSLTIKAAKKPKKGRGA